MKRLQQRLGLGDTELPDERRRPATREEEALVPAGAPLPPRPLPPHDPTHPAAEGSSRPGAATTRIQAAPARMNAPSVAGTTRMPTQRPAAPKGEPATTRMPAAANDKKPRTPVSNANGPAPRTRRAAPPPVREDREIESWLGELRGNGPTPPPARPLPRPQEGAEPTTAIPTQRPRAGRARAQDPETTEKLNAQPEDESRRRGVNGGVSAQELLRREGHGR